MNVKDYQDDINGTAIEHAQADRIREEFPEVWKAVTDEFWEGIPLDLGCCDPDIGYFVKKCLERLEK